MFEEFASGYYMRPYWVVEDSGKGRINELEYEYVLENLYDNVEPIVMKLGNIHFRVEGDESVIPNTIHVDPSFTEQVQMGGNPSKEPVFLAKPSVAGQILSLSNQYSGEGFDVTSTGE